MVKRIFESFAALAATLLLASLLLFSCGKDDGGKVIPKDKLSEIYAEMFVLDQWVGTESRLRREADTSMVYAPILEKYGYNYDDYLASVDYYMKDPERYSRILRTTSELLNRRLSELQAQKKEMESAEKAAHRRDSLLNLVHFDLDSAITAMSRVNPSDSLISEIQPFGVLSIRFVQRGDTSYAGPEVIVRCDTLKTVSDSLKAVSDSLKRAGEGLGTVPGSFKADAEKGSLKLAPENLKKAPDSALVLREKDEKFRRTPIRLRKGDGDDAKIKE